jgi:hypothetical protein
MTRAHGTPSCYRQGPDEPGTLADGCRCTQCRAANAAQKRHRTRMIAYGRWEGQVDATGTQRRLQALIWNGWSMGLLAGRLGCARSVIRRRLLVFTRVYPAAAEEVRVLYDGLWDQAPPEGTPREKRAATMARRYARENGFAPPLAWDDDTIDDPDASPAEGWERRDVRRWGTLAEEAGELFGFGLGVDGAAERLGVSRNTLTTTLGRARKREETADAA